MDWARSSSCLSEVVLNLPGTIFAHMKDEQAFLLRAENSNQMSIKEIFIYYV